MFPKPVRTYLTMTSDRQAFLTKLSIAHFLCFLLFSLQNSLYLDLPELRSTTEAWIFLIFLSITVRAKCTKSYHIISCLWVFAFFFFFLITVCNVLFQVALVIETGILWNASRSLFPWCWGKFFFFFPHSYTCTITHMCPCFSIYYTFSPTRIYSPKQNCFFDDLLCPLPNRGGHNT